MLKEGTALKLHELLDANARFDLAARGTTNHCPMALVALAEMGASPARLQEFFDMWEREYALSAPPVGTIIDRREWASHLGNTAAFGALRLCFLDWMADDDPDMVIATVLKEVPFAPATGAFHALIRLAYGIEAAHRGEIAAGLAALISSHLPIDVSFAERPAAESADAAFVHVACAMGDDLAQGNSITARLRAVAGDVRFRRAILAPPVTSSLLDDIARAAIAAYWRTPDFTVLHTVTAAHAARTLFARLDDSLVEPLLPGLWVALCAAYATVRKPLDVEAITPDIDAGWNEVCQRAMVSNDDHVIKMTYTCLCENRREPSPLYLASAARAVGMG
ncbi:questin oxidase family protein [Trinickia violacea]|uniref:Questin oxidase family protein n=1 Tax=Trinickia violacea TaxID=2571746 RepID=A0A4P8ITR2_9BURK|nr:questin oxidase family protein [Trinickia violacea]QCP52618.1 questin oxidase family protein [Trinickia violacea]